MYSEETASPGLWKSEIVGLIGLAVVAAAFMLPPTMNPVYINWLFGAIASNSAIAMAGNRKWERPLASAAGIWLFMSGFVPSTLSGSALMMNYLGVGAVLILAALSANIHLRDDIRHARPLTM
jgi:hypothetical protein